MNHLATKPYRELLFSIHYQNRPSKKEILIEHLEWYQKNLEKRMTEDFDRNLSTLLDCNRVILGDLKS